MLNIAESSGIPTCFAWLIQHVITSLSRAFKVNMFYQFCNYHVGNNVSCKRNLSLFPQTRNRTYNLIFDASMKHNNKLMHMRRIDFWKSGAGRPTNAWQALVGANRCCHSHPQCMSAAHQSPYCCLCFLRHFWQYIL